MSAGPSDLTSGDEARMMARASDLFRSLLPAIEKWASTLPPDQPIGFVGCGSSLDIPEALVDAVGVGRAVSASEFEPEPGITWVALSRSGATREVLEAMETGAIDHVITCVPESPVAGRAAHVLDVSAAADTGFVAALSALVTAGAVAVVLGEEPDDVVSGLASGPRETGSLAAVEAVAWLGPWRAFPLGRELARKSIESGRRSSFSHQFEFLHGDDQMYGPGAAWVVLGAPAANDVFAELVDVDRRDRVVRLDVEWEAMSAASVIELLSTTYQLIFSREGR